MWRASKIVSVWETQGYLSNAWDDFFGQSSGIHIKDIIATESGEYYKFGKWRITISKLSICVNYNLILVSVTNFLFE